jgi:hypothetical protein
MASVLEGKSIGSDQKTQLSSWFGEPRIRLGTQVHSNSMIQFVSHESKLVPRKLDPGPSSKVGLMVFDCKTLLTPYVENHNQARLTSGGKCKHVGSEIWGLSLVEASNFLLIFGLLTCFVLWCQQPSLLFAKELGKPVINGQTEPAPTLIHSHSWMSPFPPIITPRGIKEMLNLNSDTPI